MSAESIPSETARWVERAVGPGASIEVASSSGRLRLVLRHELIPAWLAEEPDALAREAANLRLLAASDLPTPELAAVDADGSESGSPALLMTWLPGQVELRPNDFDAWLAELAAQIPRIHAVAAGDHPWRHKPYGVPNPVPPEWSNQPGLWPAAIEIASRPPPAFEPRFIHRDYHPCNVLFEGGRVSGIVDWTLGCIGPGGVDLSRCRGNLHLMYGIEVADRFLDLYQAAAGAESAYHPYWDVLQLVENLPNRPKVYPPWAGFGLDGLDAELMLERREAYLASVLARLG